MTLGEYTGVLNSAWYGGMTAVAGTTFLLLFGFNLVKGSINREKEFKTDKLIGSSPISKTSYVTGKWLSNFLYLSIAVTIMILATITAVLLNGKGTLSILEILIPFLTISIPTVGFISALTLLIENNDFLNGAGATALYFIFALSAITLSVRPDTALDLTGIDLMRESMSNSIAAQYPEFEGVIKGFAYTDSAQGLKKFTWQGLELTAQNLGSRLPILISTITALIASTISFDRFKHKEGILSLIELQNLRKNRNITGKLYQRISSKIGRVPNYLVSASLSETSFVQIAKSEIQFLYRDRPKWWYLASITAFITCSIAPMGTLKSLILPIILLLPTPIWSKLGVKEKKHKTEKLAFQKDNGLKLLKASTQQEYCPEKS